MRRNANNNNNAAIYNLNYPVIDKVLKSLAVRLNIDSKNDQHNYADGFLANSSNLTGIFYGLAKMAKDLEEQNESSHRSLQRCRNQHRNISNICVIMSNLYQYNMKKVCFHHWRKLLHKNRKFRNLLQVIERDLWQDNRVSNIFFTASMCQRCVQRFGKVRLASLFHHWITKRRIFSSWLKSIILLCWPKSFLIIIY